MTHFERIKVRSDTTDSRSVKEIAAYKKVPIPHGCTVVDIGGHIGSFTNWALDKGAGNVIVFEPEPDNFRMLRINTKGLPVKAYRCAVTGDGRKVVLNVKTSGHTGGHSIVYSGPTRKQLVVPSKSFISIVDRFLPEVVKIDCEGAEYEYGLPHSLPDSVRYLVVELHLQRKSMMKSGKELLRKLSTWKEIKCSKVTDKSWTAVGIWERSSIPRGVSK
jgi:FkbM family methyltransferase